MCAVVRCSGRAGAADEPGAAQDRGQRVQVQLHRHVPEPAAPQGRGPPLQQHSLVVVVVVLVMDLVWDDGSEAFLLLHNISVFLLAMHDQYCMHVRQ